jgi:hypothetical protein
VIAGTGEGGAGVAAPRSFDVAPFSLSFLLQGAETISFPPYNFILP